MALNYNFINYGAKADVNDKVSVGVFFDQPWGADVEFKGNNNFVNNPQVNLAIATKSKENLDKISLTDPNYKKGYEQQDAAARIAQNSAQPPNVSVDSKNFTGLVGVKFGEKNNWQVYGGPVLQKLEGEVHLRGTAYNSTQSLSR